MRRASILVLVALAPQAMAEETRQMQAHVHGVSTLEVAIDGNRVEMALASPGMDLVGFEHRASTQAQTDAILAALDILGTPEAILALPQAAGCRVDQVKVEGPDHEAHDHASDHHDGHDHDANDHDEHDHDGHDQEGHDQEGQDHQDHAAHSAFSAHYAYTCDAPEQIDRIAVPFFQHFDKAEKIDAVFVTSAGAGTAQITRATPTLNLAP